MARTKQQTAAQKKAAAAKRRKAAAKKKKQTMGEHIASIGLGDEKVTTNPSTKTDDIMLIDRIIKQPIMKEGKKTGKFRYRVAGTFMDTGTNVTRFVSKAEAESRSKNTGITIKTEAVKSKAQKAAARKKSAAARRKKSQKSCEDIGKGYTERCRARRS